MPASLSFSVASPRGPRAARVVHERRGAGRPLVLLHGIGHHWQAWEPVLDILSADRDVIAVDLPGFGASDALPDGIPYDLEGVIPVLGALFEALGVTRPDVAGNSLGGLLALELGRVGLVRSVTALSPARFWTEAERRYAFGVLSMMRAGARALPPPAVAWLAR
ncbi:alpha/beta fold hydrolase, partial [Streptomyces sp. SID8361]|uniref:alpha/beta fold hydrolase n=1 Tax=Streptomyces sp. MnatMP-M27 TaxID=1839768 RepID=UPI00081F2B32